MVSWSIINSRIRECRHKSSVFERIKCIKALLTEFGEDGMIYYRLGEQYEFLGDYNKALECYTKAYTLFPLPDWKERALTSINRVKAKLYELQSMHQTHNTVSWSEVIVDENTLFIVNCTARKAWDICNGLPRYLPAVLAYQGSSFHKFLSKIRELEKTYGRIYWVILSAKYGFIEPCKLVENYDVTFNNQDAVSDVELREQVLRNTVYGRKLSSFSKVYVYTRNNLYYEKVTKAFAGIAECYRILD